jgi:hypothetical protein
MAHGSQLVGPFVFRYYCHSITFSVAGVRQVSQLPSPGMSSPLVAGTVAWYRNDVKTKIVPLVLLLFHFRCGISGASPGQVIGR